MGGVETVEVGKMAFKVDELYLHFMKITLPWTGSC